MGQNDWRRDQLGGLVWPEEEPGPLPTAKPRRVACESVVRRPEWAIGKSVWVGERR